jgi:hypothetical protein
MTKKRRGIDKSVKKLGTVFRMQLIKGQKNRATDRHMNKQKKEQIKDSNGIEIIVKR